MVRFHSLPQRKVNSSTRLDATTVWSTNKSSSAHFSADSPPDRVKVGEAGCEVTKKLLLLLIPVVTGKLWLL